jgi:hypothetical protein
MARKNAARTFTVNHVMATNVAKTEACVIPGMVLTVPELRTIVADPYTVQVWCCECGESVADCPIARKHVQAPAEWSTMGDVPWRMPEGLAVFAR